VNPNPLSWTRRGQVGLAVVAVAAVLPVALSPYGRFLAAATMALAIYGVAYDLAYGYVGLLSFGHAVFFGVGAYAVAFAVNDGGLTLLPSLVVAVGAALVVALLMGAVAVRLSENGFVIVTIIFVLVANLAAITFSDITGGYDGFTISLPPLRIPGLGSFNFFDGMVQYYVVFVALIGVYLLLRRLARSQVGLVFRMVRDNETRAELVGYNVTAYKLAALAVSGAFTGLAGAFEALIIGYVNASNFTLPVSADPLVYTLIGGRGSLLGPIIGAVVLRIAEELIKDVVTVYPLFVGLLLVAVLVFEREGVLGAIRRFRGEQR
jgi:branched-chain amino acid transport system permease protein